MDKLDYLTDFRRESARFHSVLATVDPRAPVPSCPDWTAEDLLWHLTEVQTFWGAIVRDRAQEVEERAAVKPDVGYQDLLDGFRSASADLAQAFADTPDDVPVWTWADDHTVGFIRRRQAHEALIHRLDAELVADRTTPMDPALASDGVDEILTVMYGGWPAWSTFTPADHVGRMVATDTGARWDLRTGRFAGTSPNTGKSYDNPTVEVSREALAADPAFTISAPAAELDAWLWNRRIAADPTIVGDHAAAEQFLAVIAAGIQ